MILGGVEEWSGNNSSMCFADCCCVTSVEKCRGKGAALANAHWALLTGDVPMQAEVTYIIHPAHHNSPSKISPDRHLAASYWVST